MVWPRPIALYALAATVSNEWQHCQMGSVSSTEVRGSGQTICDFGPYKYNYLNEQLADMMTDAAGQMNVL